MTLTPAIKLHPTALMEAKLHCVGKTGGGRPGIGAPETWIQIQLWNHE